MNKRRFLTLLIASVIISFACAGRFTKANLTVFAETVDDFTYKINRGDGSVTLMKYNGLRKSELIIPKVLNKMPVTAIGEAAFKERLVLTSVIIPDSVTSIGASAFEGCISLTDITIPNSVTSIGSSAFKGCTSLKDIAIPDSVTSLEGYLFSNCTSLTSISIPDSVTSIEYHAFSNCTSLTSISIPGGVTVISFEVFSNCTSLTDINIPDGVTNICSEAFANCTSLKDITIPDTVTSIAGGVFNNCTSLTSITIPESVTYIGGTAFLRTPWLELQKTENPLVIINSILISVDGQTCSGIVDIPDSVTSIGDYAFAGCSDLTTVTIPDSVTYIGLNAFCSCKKLTDVYFSGTEEQWNEIEFRDRDFMDNLSNATIHFNAAPPTALAGDCNLDGAVTVADAVALIRFVTEQKTEGAFDVSASDFNSDGIANILDVRDLLKSLAA